MEGEEWLCREMSVEVNEREQVKEEEALGGHMRKLLLNSLCIFLDDAKKVNEVEETDLHNYGVNVSRTKFDKRIVTNAQQENVSQREWWCKKQNERESVSLSVFHTKYSFSIHLFLEKRGTLSPFLIKKK